MTYGEAQQLAVDREEWRQNVAQCVFDTGEVKVRSLSSLEGCY